MDQCFTTRVVRNLTVPLRAFKGSITRFLRIHCISGSSPLGHKNLFVVKYENKIGMKKSPVGCRGLVGLFICIRGQGKRERIHVKDIKNCRKKSPKARFNLGSPGKREF